MADSKTITPVQNPKHRTSKSNGTPKPYTEELKDDRFQGTGDSELDTTPPAKENEGRAPGRDRKSHGAETDVDPDGSNEQ